MWKLLEVVVVLLVMLRLIVEWTTVVAKRAFGEVLWDESGHIVETRFGTGTQNGRNCVSTGTGSMLQKLLAFRDFDRGGLSNLPSP